MNIAEISSRTGLPTRRLRYVLEHNVLPGGNVKSRGRGAVRSFTRDEAFGLSVATTMLEAGLRRPIVRACIEVFSYRFPATTPLLDIPLQKAFHGTGEVWLDVADGVNLRLHGAKGLDTGWVQANTGAKLATGYDPVVLLRIKVSAIRDQVQRGT